MSNPLFRQARQFVEEAKHTVEFGSDMEIKASIAKAKNALSSAYANCNVYEQRQLRQLQGQLLEITEP
ncbi:DUF3813 domain-containing protein [Bacillus coahuilensis]|uniref:DUF3813 domain-containing protein n=1 Tax=Bacillus coahuilensis TaxID=408580 RepID=UPI0001850CB9|nr:DUF3813 domain-containing protein [Bacillus coahuilensis]